MRKIVIANWKMNPQEADDAKALFANVKKIALASSETLTVIAPPTAFLSLLASKNRSTKIAFCAQNIHWLDGGPVVGECSARQAKSVGATFVLIGHSARRNMGETNEQIANKLNAVIKHKLTPVLFVGEEQRDLAGDFLMDVKEQVRSALKNVSKNAIKKVVFVYEPVWAISTNEAHSQKITTHQIHQMALFIRKILSEICDLNTARAVRVLYGGSVNAANIQEIIKIPEIQGVAVGSASLDWKQIGSIIKITDKTK